MLEIRDLRVRFHNRDRDAVAGISLSIQDGEILGLVGESGSGKSVTAMSVAGLLPRKQCDYSGQVLLDGRELLHADRAVLRTVQGRDIGVVFQEPQSALDPLTRIGPQVEESLRIHTNQNRARRRALALEALEAVELPRPDEVYRKYPHELSGGMLQRVCIAAAVITRPRLLLLDEPTTALDVTIQAQILELCGRVAVMQRGTLVEEGLSDEVFRCPRHPYTQRLVSAIPTRTRREVMTEGCRQGVCRRGAPEERKEGPL